jgi:alkyl sulfatase BDS1-like metallo-beta-lactamase superfamily hydrolase
MQLTDEQKMTNLGPANQQIPRRRAAGWNPTRRSPQLIRVTSQIYAAVNYAISNVIFIITHSSVVVIDTSESRAAAKAILLDFRKVCEFPITHIIYTHFHGDHIHGATVFHRPGTRVISQRLLPSELQTTISLLGYRTHADALQFGAGLDLADRGVTHAGMIAGAIGLDRVPGRSSPHYNPRGYIPPDITFDDEYKFSEGGVDFELYHTQGETVDHLMVWIPSMKALMPGDLFYWGFPMLSSPMKPDRPVLAWARSLERMRELRPALLVPSHSKPLNGMREIDEILGNYARAVRFVHDETVGAINQGIPVEEIRRNLRLPKDLAELPYLREGYGKVAWAVNGIYRQYTGWYDLNPSTLRRNTRGLLERTILAACAGAAPLNNEARAAFAADKHQLVLELTDIVLAAQPLNDVAAALRIASLRKLGEATGNGVERNLYLGAAATLARRLQNPDAA